MRDVGREESRTEVSGRGIMENGTWYERKSYGVR